MNLLRYEANLSNFSNIQASPFVYWIPELVFDIFKKNGKLDNYLEVKNGMSTTDNNRFLRFWYEIKNGKICYHAEDRKSAMLSQKKWFPYNKGGEYRKWYGNMIYVCNWEKDGQEIRKCAEGASGGRIVSEDYYFNSSLSWSKISSGQFSLRFYDNGYLFDVAGPSIFGDINKRLYALAVCNSKLKKLLLESISSTLNYERGQVALFPINEDNNSFELCVNISNENIKITRNDWNSFETSWDFKKHPLI